MRAANVVTRTDNCVQDNNPLQHLHLMMVALVFWLLLANQTSTSTTIAQIGSSSAYISVSLLAWIIDLGV